MGRVATVRSTMCCLRQHGPPLTARRDEPSAGGPARPLMHGAHVGRLRGIVSGSSRSRLASNSPWPSRTGYAAAATRWPFTRFSSRTRSRSSAAAAYRPAGAAKCACVAAASRSRNASFSAASWRAARASSVMNTAAAARTVTAEAVQQPPRLRALRPRPAAGRASGAWRGGPSRRGPPRRRRPPGWWRTPGPATGAGDRPRTGPRGRAPVR